ncbi:transcriptional regulator, BadM/Rrf2 family [Alkalidesulfovibrio alkalitolerans DSM 16529]|uniref:Transcriptional regulator, BadM/Rrf2 family n=1 Tax=Alkalidesulfovibrio alkalitolerans DSM 16529 TaxID=1121439 RepID=S7UEV8_9BACT|nr:Rrf2 family transcriptional regulator [Alkalidesulfovibrio alkalitolerans]EPR30748.1 transcriptional regulator, BadM/Rrf2 family [Alkalidesulfovibrio alkalitolerans DSM 16529]
MRLSTKSRYGTRLLLDIALNDKDGPVRIQDTAERQKISVKYLEHIAQILRKAGYLTSTRGKKGGHSIAMPPESISLGEVIKLLEGDSCLVDCGTSSDHCEMSDKCITRMLWMDASSAMFEKLNTFTLADLIDQARSGAFPRACPGGNKGGKILDLN